MKELSEAIFDLLCMNATIKRQVQWHSVTKFGHTITNLWARRRCWSDGWPSRWCQGLRSVWIRNKLTMMSYVDLGISIHLSWHLYWRFLWKQRTQRTINTIRMRTRCWSADTCRFPLKPITVLFFCTEDWERTSLKSESEYCIDTVEVRE